MKIVGIYALYWEVSSMVYIGQSQQINRRFSEHIAMLKAGKHTNYKVTEQYSLYGLPELIILETCDVSKLNELEIAWTREFNSIEEGLNIVEAGNVGYGSNSNASKYSKLQILKVFRALYSGSILITYKNISLNLGVNESLVADISRGSSHNWLQHKYPFLYRKMLSNKGLRLISIKTSKTYESTHGKPATILDVKTGTTYQVSNITAFAKEYGLDRSHLSAVIRGDKKQHKNFILLP
jgi:group I intron endonuclease